MSPGKKCGWRTVEKWGGKKSACASRARAGRRTCLDWGFGVLSRPTVCCGKRLSYLLGHENWTQWAIFHRYVTLPEGIQVSGVPVAVPQCPVSATGPLHQTSRFLSNELENDRSNLGLLGWHRCLNSMGQLQLLQPEDCPRWRSSMWQWLDMWIQPLLWSRIRIAGCHRSCCGKREMSDLQWPTPKFWYHWMCKSGNL